MNKTPKKKLAVRLYEAIYPPKAEKRHYAAARHNRLNAGWATQPTTANYEQMDLSVLIARSRDAARNDLHIVNYLRLMRANVIGQNGIQLQSRARAKDQTLNVDLNKRVEEAWWQWTHAETCTVSGKLDWKGVQDLAITQCERDGAFLIQMVDADNDFGFALRTWDVTWFDLTYMDTLPGGNRVIRSVEIDDYGKPVAYWLTTPSSEMNFTKRQARERTRIAADKIIHGFLVNDDESQVHGVPGTAAALLPAKNAYSYCEAQIMASRFAVNQFAVLKNTVPDPDLEWEGKENDDGSPNHPLIESSPLAITALLPGWEMQQFKPDHPTMNHSAYKQSLDMDIAAALGVPYFLLMGDWKAVNFSSSRGGLGEFRERCKSYQNFVATNLCRRVFHAWLSRAVLTGKLKVSREEYIEIHNPTWVPRGFDYVDPAKDIATDILKLQNRLTTPSEILAERGIDYMDQLERWESDKALAAEKGQDIDELYTDQPKQLTAAPAENEPDEDDTDETPDEPADDTADPADERALLETLLMKADLGVPREVLHKEMGYEGPFDE